MGESTRSIRSRLSSRHKALVSNGKDELVSTTTDPAWYEMHAQSIEIRGAPAWLQMWSDAVRTQQHIVDDLSIRQHRNHNIAVLRAVWFRGGYPTLGVLARRTRCLGLDLHHELAACDLSSQDRLPWDSRHYPSLPIQCSVLPFSIGYSVSVTRYGGRCDGRTDNAEAFRNYPTVSPSGDALADV